MGIFFRHANDAMSTMGMYRVRWPAINFGKKYQNKRPKVSQDFSSVCQTHWIAVMDCVRKTPFAQRGRCQRYMHEMWDCVDAVNVRKEELKTARYRLAKFMRGRESFGVLI